MARLAKAKAPRVLPGSLIMLRRKCGKASCRCVAGDPHESPALSYSVAGRTKMLTLRPEEVADVARAVARYRKSVNDLAAEAQGELDKLVARVKASRASER